MSQISPFLDPGRRTAAQKLAIVQLSRDHLEPIILGRSDSATSDGYAEGVVLNTRFGSFPHSTLIGVPWGSQVRASAVDTGSRGRKRKRGGADEEEKAPTPGADGQDATINGTGEKAQLKKAVVAASGFAHILPPTPEIWTSSLPHRTQVVYTPDYSYILQRICARPGTRLIEAGAGSGSFTHASARAVYNGYPVGPDDKKGKVFSFEFHEPRYRKMTEEIRDHGLQEIVQITHRDVYEGGFLVDGKNPEATAVFLDLPAPWDALPNLSRRRPQRDGDGADSADADKEWVSPLDPARSVYICTFSPCIEQVTRTITTMRSLGWVEVDMVEISHKRLPVMRDRVGVGSGGDSTANQAPGDVEEAVRRLKEIEERTKDYHANIGQAPAAGAATNGTTEGEKMDVDALTDEVESALAKPDQTKPWMQGRLVHRSEAELKMHTSYLVFAVLPREWSEEEEAAALARWPCGGEQRVIGKLDRDARKREKREIFEGKRKGAKGGDSEVATPTGAAGVAES